MHYFYNIKNSFNTIRKINNVCVPLWMCYLEKLILCKLNCNSNTYNFLFFLTVEYGFQ